MKQTQSQTADRQTVLEIYIQLYKAGPWFTKTRDHLCTPLRRGLAPVRHQPACECVGAKHKGGMFVNKFVFRHLFCAIGGELRHFFACFGVCVVLGRGTLAFESAVRRRHLVCRGRQLRTGGIEGRFASFLGRVTRRAWS